jgi:hypothetical protein
MEKSNVISFEEKATHIRRLREEKESQRFLRTLGRVLDLCKEMKWGAVKRLIDEEYPDKTIKRERLLILFAHAKKTKEGKKN